MYDRHAREKEGPREIAPRTWSGPTDILMHNLEKEARTAPDLEAYRELLRTPTCRLGLTAVLGAANEVRFIVVVLVDRSPRAASVEAALARRGYTSMRLDEGWVAHDRAVSRSRLAAELGILRGVMQMPEGSA